MLKELDEFHEHVNRVHTQHAANDRLKKNLPVGECIVQMDFSENYTCQNMDEIQSAYWTNASITLHPVVVWFKADDKAESLTTKSYVFVVSDVHHHNSAAVLTIVSKLVPLIKQEVAMLTKIHYWTDSPTPQYRNKSVFYLISHHEAIFGVNCSWNYFESGHGKGPCDGIGGCAKWMAADAVKQNTVVIQDAFQFFTWATKTQKKIDYILYTEEDYEQSVQTINCWSSEFVSIRGTMH